jgi:hypothetical protein
MTIATICQIDLQNGGINDPERTLGRKYQLFEKRQTFALQARSAGVQPDQPHEYRAAPQENRLQPSR